MHGPPLVGWLTVALCGAAGALCLLRIRVRGGGREQRRGAGGEALMGLGMAAMAVPAAALKPQPWAAPVFAAVFAAAALHALLLARGDRHHLHHAVGSLAMVHMALAPAHADHAEGLAAQPASGAPALTGLLLAYFAVYVLRTGVGIVPLAAAPSPVSPAAPAAAGPGWVHRPELATACRVSMGMGMFAMLLTV
ncbi:DUF5134 domain-containing protein [Streptomyces sp. 7N604]|uniref:DUF5134 domain-containing protein n=1 Tax=Streptomyces sp. 7N604 TaxID=3457415 RepID=UPI003FD54007